MTTAIILITSILFASVMLYEFFCIAYYSLLVSNKFACVLSVITGLLIFAYILYSTCRYLGFFK